MTGPDPSFITQANWKQLGDLLMPLWMILGSVLGFAFSMLLAHGMIPSLAATKDVPANLAMKARPPLYGAAFMFSALLILGIVLFVNRLDVLSSIFYRGAQ
jgi:hypothetical protein